ncbi:MAG: DRTGG domain-containing protein [Chitinispirillia bacterium]|nr:DRTGG domain-containing protein [Chitinispirillia bacterium]MCL2269493.1 DRTGG domain-containing protein [Chitinispirillia bacterium]
MMKFDDIVGTLHARVISKSSTYDTIEAESVIVSDLMSDVLMMEKPVPLLVTSLSSDQAIRTASMVDAAGVVIAQNKPLPEKIANLAEELDITLLHSPLAKFECCVLLGKLMEKSAG